MPLRSKQSLDIINLELSGQKLLFGKDNISFKTVNLPKVQRFDNICNNFRLKKIIKKTSLILKIIIISFK